MMLSSLSFAAPAYHGEMEFIQNDGSKFSGHLKGDEYFSWVEDKQGNVIKFNKVSKNYEYAKLQMSQGEVDIVPSGVKVMNAKVPFSPSLSGQNISKEKISEIWKRKKEKVKFHH
ncbi:MAG: Unknown protein [uncultured Sulfurovum sp.]|uniref:Uncharacterized protein n=1 Tax=uncultured Sulfurovum sp. TaxID=269237 RepID=A0A6S6RVI9_9BACT|nr:MAG: Unknown protein [uncultured Sulfurovum sp.]